VSAEIPKSRPPYQANPARIPEYSASRFANSTGVSITWPQFGAYYAEQRGDGHHSYSVGINAGTFEVAVHNKRRPRRLASQSISPKVGEPDRAGGARTRGAMKKPEIDKSGTYVLSKTALAINGRPPTSTYVADMLDRSDNGTKTH